MYQTTLRHGLETGQKTVRHMSAMLQTVTPSAPFQTGLQRFMPLRDTAMTSTQQEEFEMLLLKGTISANLPFTWIDSEFIQAAFALARPTAILRSRRSLSGLLTALLLFCLLKAM